MRRRVSLDAKATLTTLVTVLLTVLTTMVLVLVLPSAGWARINYGTYTGDGSLPRTITTTITPEILLIWRIDAGGAWFKTTDMGTNDICPINTGGACNIAASTTSFTAGGFTANATNNIINVNLATYAWLAFTSESNTIAHGLYTGGGSVTVGWDADFVMMYRSSGGTQTAQKTRSMTAGYTVPAQTGVVHDFGFSQWDLRWIANGFEEGGNFSAANSYWMALKANAARGIYFGSCSGNGVDDNTCSISSTSPLWVGMWATNAANGDTSHPMWRSGDLAANTSDQWQGDNAATDCLKSFTSTTLTFGTSVECNENTKNYDVLILAQDLAAATRQRARQDL